jgi:hypothetical protein
LSTAKGRETKAWENAALGSGASCMDGVRQSETRTHSNARQLGNNLVSKATGQLAAGRIPSLVITPGAVRENRERSSPLIS